MKQFKMPSKREFQAMYPPGNDAFDCAVRATLDALPDDSPNRMCVKRKMSVGLAAAVILVLALTCAAVAAGLVGGVRQGIDDVQLLFQPGLGGMGLFGAANYCGLVFPDPLRTGYHLVLLLDRLSVLICRF